MIADRHQDEWKQTARQRLGSETEALVNPTSTLLAQENTAAVGVSVEKTPLRPEESLVREQRKTLEFSLLRPALGLDAQPFLWGESDLVFLAAVAGNVTVPVLCNGKMTDR